MELIMDENITLNLTNDENPKKETLIKQSVAEVETIKKEAVGKPEKVKRKKLPKELKPSKKWLALMIIGIVGLIGGISCLAFVFLMPEKSNPELAFPKIPSKNTSEETYSSLTGEILPDPSLKNAPAYCIQTPNGLDGARPQSGLNEAGVIFEAIAEAGITRFASIYQNPGASVIGPIRSLRLYYLEWDTPFDCTIVHAGGADDAIAAVSSGGYKDLSEDYQYMYRGTYGSRLWNNLFTTSAYLKQFSSSHGYDTSDIKGFSRLTPDESEKVRVNESVKEKLEITTPTTENTSSVSVKIPSVSLRFGGYDSFNVDYTYDEKSNKYLRSYGSGVDHEVYECSQEDLGERNPEDVCKLTQLTPSVVVAIMVNERKASDNYHEDITTTGSGNAYIFQNGGVIEGTWSKPTRDDQITFSDKNGKEIKLAPGQTFVSAIPNYGSIDY
ncbi:DUF3048 domain-containing protein [Candidatus Saccharibacteria bacterium]|nr:DUF3048 domain-containing protein [Candidatus Saccharibacteria bacterium]